MASTPQIISDLKVMMDAHHQLELLSSFRGVPFVCKADIDSVEENMVRLRALEPSMVCLERDRQPRILGSDYFEPATARVVNFDIVTGMVELSDFSYVGTKLGERMIVRVEPREAVDVRMESGGVESIGSLADISFSGVGVRTLYANYASILRPGTTVQVSMQLPTGQVSMPGTVLSIVKMKDFYRLSIRFAPDGPQKGLIFRYLVDRRAEIERELNENYTAFVREKGGG